MVADTGSMKVPLVVVAPEECQVDAAMVRHHLERDNDAALRQLVADSGVEAVMRPRATGPSMNLSNSLHLAARLGATKCLEVLLAASLPANTLDAPNADGSSPLLVAAAAGKVAATRRLLEAGASVTARDDHWRGVLQVVVVEMTRPNKTHEDRRDLLQVAKVLLEPPHVHHVDLEAQAPLATTPLTAAITKLAKADANTPWRNDLLEVCVLLLRAGATATQEQRHALQTLGCELPAHTPTPPPRRPTAGLVVDAVCGGAGSAEALKEAVAGRPDREVQDAVRGRVGSHSLLFLAVDGGNQGLVDAMLTLGANPWELESSGELPLHRAAARGHTGVFDALVVAMRGGDGRVDLRLHTLELVRKVLECGRGEACLSRLLQEDVVLDANQEEGGLTPLLLATAFNNQAAATHLLRAGAFLGARRSLMGRDCGGVLEGLLPRSLHQAMDGCVSQHNNKADSVTAEDYTLRLDYHFLLPPQAATHHNEAEALMAVCRSGRHRHAIKHPLVQTLLFAKWRRVLPLYLLNVAAYLTFVVLLTAFVYLLKDLRVGEARLARLALNGTIDTSSLQEEVEGRRVGVHGVMGVLVVAWVCLVGREVFQMVFSKEFYLKSIENYLECFLVVVVVVLVAAPLNLEATRHLAAWAMIVAWYEFVLVLGRAPPLALYITMLRHVSWNFLKLIFLFSALILAFTISFNIILQPASQEEDSDFSNFWTTLPKAIVMSTGEFEYSDLSTGFPRTILMTSAVSIFLVFLFLIFLVLMNVMNGLAVTDTQQVVEDAKLYSLTSRLELVYLVETFFLKCPGLQKHLHRLQVISGPTNTPSLLVRINCPKKGERLLSGKSHMTANRLDSDTTEYLREHWLQYLEERDKEDRHKSAGQLAEAVQDLAVQHPDLLLALSSALRP